MLRFSHPVLMRISGSLWLCIGAFLLWKGIHLIADPLELGVYVPGEANYAFLEKIAPLVGGVDHAAMILIVVCLLIGHFKGKVALLLSVKRVARRVLALPNPGPLSGIYSWRYYLLIASMVGLGLLINVLKASNDIRGAVDVAIGSALIQGAFLFYRYASLIKKGMLNRQSFSVE